MTTEAKVNRIPTCDICKDKPASHDGKTIYGPWAYMCPQCFADHGVGVGTGRGQRLVLH